MANMKQQTEMPIGNPQAPIHRVQAGKDQHPFFFLHGDWWAEIPLYTYLLSRTLGRKRPFYALEPYHFDGPVKPLTLEEMAAEHLKTIKVIQPEGPYLLGGYCNGALLACEITHQLQIQGEEVKLLLLITPSTLTNFAKRIQKALLFLGKLLFISPKRQRNLFIRVRHARRYILRRLQSVDNIRFSGYNSLLDLDPRLKKMFPPLEALYKEFAGPYTWLASTYQPRFDSQPTRFIWVEDDLDKRPYWQEFEQEGIPITVLPGSHIACITDNAGLLAEHVKAYLDQIETEELVIKP